MTNFRGDVIRIVNSSRATVANYRYDPWGNPTYTWENSAVAGQPIRYASYVYDGETGMYYLKARYYDPDTARFISRDPHGGSLVNPLSQNLYAYCAGDPVNFVDPDGLFLKKLKKSMQRMTKILDSTLVKMQNTTSKANLTLSSGVNLAGSFGLHGCLFLGVTADAKGNIAIQGGRGLGGGFPGVSATRYVTITNAPSFEYLEGPSLQFGGTGGVTGIVGGLEGIFLSERGYGGVTGMFGTGISTPIGFHAEYVRTNTLYNFNIYQPFDTLNHKKSSSYFM